MNFKELYLAGKIDFEEIDDYCFTWGDTEDSRPLREYLGLTVEEEDVWVSESEEALQKMLDQQKNK